MTLRPELAETAELLGSLVSIESINPALVPGAAGEARIAEFVAAWLQTAGLDVEVHDVLPGRPNVIGRVRGSGGGRTLILNAHIDTVGVAGMTAPFAPRPDGDRLYGRGAYDMKSGLASIMLAARALTRLDGPRGDVVITAVADEEYASAGTEAVVRMLSADAAIVTEPTNLRICAAHKGFAWLAVETRGRAAHGSKPDLGIDAIVHMGRVLRHVEALGDALAERTGHPLLGTGSVHASLIEGGQELSSYPERCRLQIERRTIPGETKESVTGEIEQLLAHESAVDPDFHGSSELLFWRDPFEVSPEEEIVHVLEECCTEAVGHRPEMYGDTPWMDAALLASAGIPTVVFGPGGAGAHAVEEWASISQTAICAEVLARSALAFC